MIFALWALACGAVEEPAESARISALPLVTWNSFTHAFVTTYCLGCHSRDNVDQRHGAPEAINFDTEADVSTYAARIRVRVLDEETMPVGGGVYAEDLVLLERYLDCAETAVTTGCTP